MNYANVKSTLMATMTACLAVSVTSNLLVELARSKCSMLSCDQSNSLFFNVTADLLIWDPGQNDMLVAGRLPRPAHASVVPCSSGTVGLQKVSVINIVEFIHCQRSP